MFFSGQMQAGLLLKAILIHSLIDAVLESENPELENTGYITKYKNLSKRNDFEIVINETYRILSFIRNIITHNKSKLIIENGRLKCSYVKSSTRGPRDLSLDISHSSLSILFAIAMLRSKITGEADKYHSLIISAMYKSALSGILEFSDEYTSTTQSRLSEINIVEGVKWRRRYRVKPQHEKFNGEKIKFARYPKLDEYSGDEYEFVHNNEIHIIPGEALDNNGEIPMQDALEWRITNKALVP